MADVTVTAAQVRPGHQAVTVKGASESAVTAGVGKLFRLSDDETTWELADASTAVGAAGLLGICVSGIKGNTSGNLAAGEMCDFVVFGPVFGFSSLAAPTTHFVSDTAGAISDVAGTASRAVGYALNASTFFVIYGAVASA